MTNFRPCNSKIGMVESKYTVQIEGRGDLVVNSKSSPSGTVRMNLYDVAYAPTLDYNLISMSKARRAGNNYPGVDNGMHIRVKSGEEFVVPEVGGMCVGSGTRVDIDETETACAVIAPGRKPTNDVDINDYHCTTAHAHPRLLRDCLLYTSPSPRD